MVNEKLNGPAEGTSGGVPEGPPFNATTLALLLLFKVENVVVLFKHPPPDVEEEHELEEQEDATPQDELGEDTEEEPVVGRVGLAFPLSTPPLFPPPCTDSGFHVPTSIWNKTFETTSRGTSRSTGGLRRHSKSRPESRQRNISKIGRAHV